MTLTGVGMRWRLVYINVTGTSENENIDFIGIKQPFVGLNLFTNIRRRINAGKQLLLISRLIRLFFLSRLTIFLSRYHVGFCIFSSPITFLIFLFSAFYFVTAVLLYVSFFSLSYIF